VETGWQAGYRSLSEVYEELGRMQFSLQQWSKKEFGSVNRQLKAMRHKLEVVRANSLRSGPTKEECELMKKFRTACKGRSYDEAMFADPMACER
jgi:hypothetical protein